MRLINLLLIVSIFGVTVSYGSGGSSAGNGTDNPPAYAESAWFPGSENIIRYCIEIAPGFGVSSEAAQEKIEQAFATWHEYLSEKGIEKMYAHFHLSFATQLQLQNKCDGNEDLGFYFGVSDDLISKYRALYDNPTAFVAQTSYDLAKNWGKGFIWFSFPGSITPDAGFPDWSKGHTLDGILLHEIGHVFGNSHVSGTIMDQNLSPMIQQGNYPDSDLTKIDFRRQLAMCWRCAIQYSGLIGWDNPSVQAKESAAKTFEFFVGRAPVGNVHAEISGTSVESLDLKISDDAGTAHLTLNFGSINSNEMPFFDSGVSLFKIAQSNSSATSYGGFGAARYGSVTLSQNGVSTVLNLVMEVNARGFGSAGGPINIKYLKDGQAKTLFRSVPN